MKRLEILKEHQVIDQQVYDDCLNVHFNFFVDYHSLNAYETFMTHLAMSMQRIKNEQPISEVEQFILTEMQDNPNFDLAQQLVTQLCPQLHVSFPESEIHYLWLHTLNMLAERRK